MPEKNVEINKLINNMFLERKEENRDTQVGTPPSRSRQINICNISLELYLNE